MTSESEICHFTSECRNMNSDTDLNWKVESDDSDKEDNENIPYHARQYARPFTYGNLPKDFKTSDLNHVAIEEVLEAPKMKKITNFAVPSPTIIRKSNRPTISASPPVFKKTPSRKEFEEMLLERREQALQTQATRLKQLEQNAAIQKDLDDLQKRLMKPLCKETETTDNSKALIKEPNQFIKKDCMPYVSKEPTIYLTTEEIEMPTKEIKRSETPSFPVQKYSTDERCISPYPVNEIEYPEPISNEIEYKILFQDSSKIKKENNFLKSDTQVVEPHLVKFAKDYSEFWYKPHITRDDAVSLLRDASPGTFLIRNSTTYKDAYGLVLKVARPPKNVASEFCNSNELVRHFLLEPTTRGVHLKGCQNEPVFTSLSAFVYQHSITPLTLPCKLVIPEKDLMCSYTDTELIAAQKQVLKQGAACNVLYLSSMNMESLTGDEAVKKAVSNLYEKNILPCPVEVHFKVSVQGVTLTDNTRKLFFRKHYVAKKISHFGMDPESRYWHLSKKENGGERILNKTIFAFVAKPLTGSRDNECHVFCELADTQPASAIICFAKKVLPLDKHNHEML